MKVLQSDPRRTKQVRIDEGYWYLLKNRAAKERVTIKELLEGYLADLLAIDDKEK